eukprot:1178836-Prorocentrum_minimum.AAC.1
MTKIGQYGGKYGKYDAHAAKIRLTYGDYSVDIVWIRLCLCHALAGVPNRGVMFTSRRGVRGVRGAGGGP